jgi:hypothetical protein
VDDTGRPGGRDLDDGLGGRGVVPDPGAARPVAARITVHTPDLAAVTRIEDLYLRRRIRVLSIPATPPSRLPPA